MIRSGLVGPGRVGTGRLITDVSSSNGNYAFHSMDHVLKIDIKRDAHCFEFPHVTAEVGSRLLACSASLAITSNLLMIFNSRLLVQNYIYLATTGNMR